MGKGTYVTLQLVVTAVGVLAAIWVGWNTHQTRRDIAKADRARRLEQTLRLAQKINEAAASVDERGGQLKSAYEGYFSLAGHARGYKHGSGDTKLDRIVNEIWGKRETVSAMQKTARHLLEDDLETLNTEQIEGHRTELQGYLMHIEEIRRRFEDDLDRVEAQRSGMITSDALRSLERQVSLIAANRKLTL